MTWCLNNNINSIVQAAHTSKQEDRTHIFYLWNQCLGKAKKTQLWLQNILQVLPNWQYVCNETGTAAGRWKPCEGTTGPGATRGTLPGVQEQKRQHNRIHSIKKCSKTLL